MQIRGCRGRVFGSRESAYRDGDIVLYRTSIRLSPALLSVQRRLIDTEKHLAGCVCSHKHFEGNRMCPNKKPDRE
jgi:hypothetical protein